MTDALANFEATAAEPIFAEDVTLTITMPATRKEDFTAWLVDFSLGKIAPMWE